MKPHVKAGGPAATREPGWRPGGKSNRTGHSFTFIANTLLCCPSYLQAVSSQDVTPILQTISSYPNTLFYFVAFIITCNDLFSSFLSF